MTSIFSRPGIRIGNTVDCSSFPSYVHMGALDGGPHIKKWQCPCRYCCNFHVNLQIVLSRLSNLRKGPRHVGNIFLLSVSSMSHVDFKKVACRPVLFKGQGPPYGQCNLCTSSPIEGETHPVVRHF